MWVSLKALLHQKLSSKFTLLSQAGLMSLLAILRQCEVESFYYFWIPFSFKIGSGNTRAGAKPTTKTSVYARLSKFYPEGRPLSLIKGRLETPMLSFG
jgi:hypothetical protein